VRTRVDPRLRAETERFAFRFACEDCAHFAERDDRCSLAYPASPRRIAIEDEHLELCKAFELA
jgi:hypothetical protein